MDNVILKQFIAVRAVIAHEGKLLLIRESQKYEGGANKGRYDFPGGKVKIGESLTEAIGREAEEEAGIRVEIVRPFHVGEWRPIVRGEQVQIIGIFYLCKPLSIDIKLGKDHDEYLWIDPKEAGALPLIKETLGAIETLNKLELLEE